MEHLLFIGQKLALLAANVRNMIYLVSIVLMIADLYISLSDNSLWAGRTMTCEHNNSYQLINSVNEKFLFLHEIRRIVIRIVSCILLTLGLQEVHVNGARNDVIEM